MCAGKVVNSALLEETKGKINLWGKHGFIFAGFKFSHLILETLLRREFYPRSILVESQGESVVMHSGWDSDGIQRQPSWFMNLSSCTPSRVADVQASPPRSSLGGDPSGVLKPKLLGNPFGSFILLRFRSSSSCSLSVDLGSCEDALNLEWLLLCIMGQLF